MNATLARAAVTEAVLARAHAHELVLREQDIVWIEDEPTIDGMPAEQWLDAMTDEDEG